MEMQERAKELKEKIEYHNKKYYEEDAQEISDYEYDVLLRELKKLELQYPELATPESYKACWWEN